ncbi:MAG: prepilin-type N-terminal cleavage/methylation domain-containing protein [Planctomycetota bacterium]
MLTPRRPRHGFTLIELLVAVTISVLLLSILAQVFKLATKATSDANMRISLTERIRALNIRMRQEIGNMLDVVRDESKVGKYACYDYDKTAQDYITFTTATDEDGRQVKVDVQYIFKKGSKLETGKLIRRRDLSGPYILDANGQIEMNNSTKPPTPKANPKYDLGDKLLFEDGKSADESHESTVMMTNVRSVKFRIIDPPLVDAKVTATMLNPRALPAAIEMEIQYGPDVGTTDILETTKIVFPIYKGL